MEKKIAILSIALAVIHFIVETIWHFRVDQFLPMLIVDYIAISLLMFAGYRSLKTGNAAGLLCGAWGFTFCLNYRTLFWRVHEFLNGNEAIATEMYFLAACMFVSVPVFFLTLYLANPRQK